MKAKQGTVGLEKHGIYYRIRLPRAIADGSSRYLSTKIAIDDPEGYKQAQRLAWDIEDEIARGTFDRSKYQNKPKQQVAVLLTLREIWQLYSDFRKPDLAISTYHSHYEGTYKKAIDMIPQSPEDTEGVKDWLVRNKPPHQARRILILINAAMDWAVSQGLVTNNKFKGLYSTVKKPKNKNIDPFSTLEMLAILEAFQGNHYESFVRFLFLTGCRTGEAIALQWKQVAPDYSYVTINATYYHELKVRKPTKTGVSRVIPCNSQLVFLLKTFTTGLPNTFVFSGHSTDYVDNKKLLRFYWKPRINQLINQGIVDRYRPLYNTRHTAITRMLEFGLTAAEVARVVGNSPKVINDHYAGVSRFTVLPEI
ncbi:site-specific integrase [Nostoc sp.]|uniref:site-specific integrase n=1 Tax=Nostoc sp. TaxID=1180 RepID=UPI002FFB64ED